MADPTPPPVDADEFLQMSAFEQRDYLQQGGVPPELDDDQLRQLPQAQLDDYLNARYIAEGGGQSWFDFLKSFQARFEANSINSEKREELLNSNVDVQYIDGLNPSDANYPGHDHENLKRYVNEELEPALVEDIALAYHDIHKAFNEFTTELKEAVQKSQ